MYDYQEQELLRKWEQVHKERADINAIFDFLAPYIPQNDVRHKAAIYFKDRWPKLGTGTGISFTNRRNVFIAEMAAPSYINLPFIRVVVSGWRKLFGVAMTPTLKRLDDPQERVAYSHRLWIAVFKSPTYLFWRVIGKVFRRTEWYERGTELVPDPVIRMPHIDHREIRLEQFGWQVNYPRYSGQQSQDYRLICGYDEVTDTLWVYSS